MKQEKKTFANSNSHQKFAICQQTLKGWVHHITNQKPSLQNCLLNRNRNKHAENT